MHSVVPNILLPKLSPALGIFVNPDKAALMGNSTTRARTGKERAFYHPVTVRFSTGSVTLFVAPCHGKEIVEYAAMLIMNQVALLQKTPGRVDYIIEDTRAAATVKALEPPRYCPANFSGLLGVSAGIPPFGDEASESRILRDKSTQRVSVVVARGTEPLCQLHLFATPEGREKELAAFAWRHIQNIYPQTYDSITLTGYFTA